jgi:hypothetical protein
MVGVTNVITVRIEGRPPFPLEDAAAFCMTVELKDMTFPFALVSFHHHQANVNKTPAVYWPRNVGLSG